MSTNEPTANDECTDSETDASLPNDEPVRPTPRGVLPNDSDVLKTTVDVEVPVEIAAAVAYRAGMRSARDGTIPVQHVHDLAVDYIQVWPRALVAGTDTPVHEWIEREADIPVDRSVPIPYPDG